MCIAQPWNQGKGIRQINVEWETKTIELHIYSKTNLRFVTLSPILIPPSILSAYHIYANIPHIFFFWNLAKKNWDARNI